MAKMDRYMGRAVKNDAGNIGEFAESKTKHTPYVEVIFEVIDGEHKGKRFPWQGYLTEKTTERTLQALKHAGCTFPGDDITNLTGLGSKDVEIQVEMTDFGPRVAWVNEPRVGSVTDETRLDKNSKAALAARLKGTLLALKGGVSTAGKAKPAALGDDPFAVPPGAANDGGQPGATGTDDQLPF